MGRTWAASNVFNELFCKLAKMRPLYLCLCNEHFYLRVRLEKKEDSY